MSSPSEADLPLTLDVTFYLENKIKRKFEDDPFESVHLRPVIHIDIFLSNDQDKLFFYFQMSVFHFVSPFDELLALVVSDHLAKQGSTRQLSNGRGTTMYLLRCYFKAKNTCYYDRYISSTI